LIFDKIDCKVLDKFHEILAKNMKGKSPDREQKNLFLANLMDFIDPGHRLSLLGEAIDWDGIETGFAPLYSSVGCPAKPVRLMVGLLILKQVYNLADETVMEEWVSNPYFQYFCGETVFQWKFPCDPSDLVHFRHRIGEGGVEKILAASILIHGKEVLDEAVSVDTTAQEKNIAYPTDTRLAVKIIKKCRKIAKGEGIELRQSYKFVVKKLLLTANSKSPKMAKERRGAKRQIKTIAGRLVRELRRKLSPEGLGKQGTNIEIFERVLAQKKDDTNKIYSLHALEVACIAKGKIHKKYEFGSKVSFATTQKSNVTVAAVNFQGNPNDNKTLEKTLDQQERLTGVRAKNAFVDRGYKSRQIGSTIVTAPGNGKGKTKYQKRKLRECFRRRAAIEPLIGHAKSDFGMNRNYLKGETGDAINAMLAATASNFKNWMRKAIAILIFVLIYIKQFCRFIQNSIQISLQSRSDVRLFAC
jgi:IS5 family transposase